MALYRSELITVDKIDGSTITPTDVVATWLACADLRQNYTTLNEVLADTPVLKALMNCTNAVDYLVRSTTWASSIVADEMAMAIIGENSYASDKLLDNSTWRTAICNSSYFKNVLNVSVPDMGSYDFPTGEVKASSEYGATQIWYAYYAFSDTYRAWCNSASPSAGQWIEYNFGYPVRVNKIQLSNNTADNAAISTFKITGSNDGVNYTDITNTITSTAQEDGATSYYNIENSEYYKYIRLVCVSGVSATYVEIKRLQFYGISTIKHNEDISDNNADISAIATNEPNATASQAYAAGEHFYKNGKFCTAKTAIASGATFTLGTNYVEGTVAEDIVSVYAYNEYLLHDQKLKLHIYSNTLTSDTSGFIILPSYIKPYLFIRAIPESDTYFLAVRTTTDKTQVVLRVLNGANTPVTGSATTLVVRVLYFTEE